MKASWAEQLVLVHVCTERSGAPHGSSGAALFVVPGGGTCGDPIASRHAAVAAVGPRTTPRKPPQRVKVYHHWPKAAMHIQKWCIPPEGSALLGSEAHDCASGRGDSVSSTTGALNHTE